MRAAQQVGILKHMRQPRFSLEASREQSTGIDPTGLRHKMALPTPLVGYSAGRDSLLSILCLNLTSARFSLSFDELGKEVTLANVYMRIQRGAAIAIGQFSL